MALLKEDKREKFIELNLKELQGINYIYNKNTRETFNDKFILYYYFYDDMKIPYDTPKFDNIDDYLVVLDYNNEITLRELLNRNNLLNKFFVIISNHNKISSIENFYVKPTDNFYSIEISGYTYNFLNVVGIDNIVINENYYFWCLPRLDIKNGNELFFFMDSNNQVIHNEIESNREDILLKNANDILKYKSTLGTVCILDNGTINNFTYTLKDRLELEKSISNGLDTLLNNGIIYNVSQDDLVKLKNKLECNSNDYLYKCNHLPTSPLCDKINNVVTTSIEIPYILNVSGNNDKLYSNSLKMKNKGDFIVNKDISIVYVCDKPTPNYIIFEQLKNSNVNYYIITPQADLVNTLKVIKTKYTLIVKSNSIIMRDLDDSFIETFNRNTSGNFIFNGTTINSSNINVLGSIELRVKGISKYVDSDICFGQTKELENFFLNEIKVSYNSDHKANNHNIENFNVELTLKELYDDKFEYMEYIDSENKLFCLIDNTSNYIVENDGGLYVIFNEYSLNERRLF